MGNERVGIFDFCSFSRPMNKGRKEKTNRAIVDEVSVVRFEWKRKEICSLFFEKLENPQQISLSTIYQRSPPLFFSFIKPAKHKGAKIHILSFLWVAFHVGLQFMSKDRA